MYQQEHREMLERQVDRTENELGMLTRLLAKACHVNALNDWELENLCRLVHDYESTRSLHDSLKDQLERAGV